MFTFHDAIHPAEPEPGRHVVLGTPLDLPAGEGREVIFLAAGCFWGVEKVFWETEGVLATAVGYMGGTTPHPTYEQVCTGATGHAETVRVVYDTSRTDAAHIISVFFEIHDPTQGDRQGNDVGSQYRSAIWTTTPGQLTTALATRDAYAAAIAARGFGPVTTEIAPAEEAGPFWQAEDYHQGYLWKHPDGYQCHTRTGIACPVLPHTPA
ncbi:peptide-methionine (S)-S-oxide reductase MsrA [Actinomyces polynesiensis]|uniref:peptide-methionine (S)-S-oxide reductase MsrA n=1 Tax=Actinomyces polynesiensis TaxID=1325934 RepID=UPI000693A33C|nr:peptide-methionine (S)-S-oxide reductase MsrA [Actinomyces polynesiensis]